MNGRRPASTKGLSTEGVLGTRQSDGGSWCPWDRAGPPLRRGDGRCGAGPRWIRGMLAVRLGTEPSAAASRLERPQP